MDDKGVEWSGFRAYVLAYGSSDISLRCRSFHINLGLCFSNPRDRGWTAIGVILSAYLCSGPVDMIFMTTDLTSIRTFPTIALYCPTSLLPARSVATRVRMMHGASV